MPPSSANSAAVGTPLTPLEPRSDPRLPTSALSPPPSTSPEWQQVWSWPAQWVVGVLLLLIVFVLALRGWRETSPQSPAPYQPYRVDLNRAGSAELVQIPGIGPQLAQRIQSQQARGGFQHIDEVRQVHGIGPVTLERIRPWVTLKPTPAAETVPFLPAEPKPLKKSKKESAFTGPPVAINTAPAVELQKVPGIGPKLSQRIIDERGRQLFQSVDELRRVPGIGPKTLEKVRPYVRVE